MFLDAACMMQVCTPKCADSCCASGMPGSHRLQSCIVHEPCSVGFLFILIDDGNALSKQRSISPMEWKHIWIKSVREQQRKKQQQQHFDYHAMFLFIIFNRSAMLSRNYFTEIVFGSIFFLSSYQFCKNSISTPSIQMTRISNYKTDKWSTEDMNVSILARKSNYVENKRNNKKKK